MKTTTFIYALSCPISGEIKYIGKANNPKSRFSKHKQMVDNNQSKNMWIKELLDSGLSPVLNILEEVSMSEWKEKEKDYIKEFRELGNLLNLCGGANGSEFGNKGSFDGRNARKIVCLSKDGIYIETFDSIKEARKKYGSGINSVLHGVTKTAYGFIWVYEDDYKKSSTDEINLIVKNANNNMSKVSWMSGLKNHQFKKGRKSLNRKPIHQYTIDDIFIKTWESATDAGLEIFKELGKQSKISMCANGLRKTAYGFKWTY